jgi:membrane-associated phospholipid phosphatase
MYPTFWLPYILVYQAINRFPLFEPRVLPMSWLDTWLPFVPSLLPLYVAYIPFYWWTGIRSEDDLALNRFFYATHLQLMLSAIVWLFFPVTMSRELFYHPETYNWADSFWRWFDAPNNCLPSLHAANCLLFLYFNWNRAGRWLTSALAVAIILSTLLVKQHYAIDLIAGFAVFAISVRFLRNLELSKLRNDADRETSSRAESGRTIRPWAA